MTKSVSLTERNRDYSVFLPSISTFYNNTIAKYRHSGNEFIADNRVPKEFEYGIDGTDFLKTNGETYYDYKWGLYSAGHAQLNLDKTDKDDNMIQARDRENTFILGDSGGFQIIGGVIKCDWDHFKTDDSLRKTIMGWLEHTADYSMILDIPTMAASSPFKEKTGIKDFNQCLDYTLHNADWFARNRTWNTKYMNVLQGRNRAEAEAWFEAVKHLPFEGWAFGGNTKMDLNIMLRHLIKMRDQKLLEQGERDLIHFLGLGKYDWGCAFTAIKRALRETVNPDIEVMYDAASAFIVTAMGQIYTQHSHKNDKFAYVTERAMDDKRLAGTDIRFPWGSPVGDRLTQGDINVYRPGDVNKNGKETKTAWDSFSYHLLMSHNVYQQIEGGQRANALCDAANATLDLDYRQWHKASAKEKKSLELDAHVPRHVLYATQFIQELFKSETPMQMLDDAELMLADFGGFKTSKSSTNSFNSLFDVEEQTVEEGELTDEQIEQAEQMLENLQN